MLNCREASKMMSDVLDRDIGVGEKLNLRLHLLFCDACRNFGKQVEFLRRAAVVYAEREAGPQDE